MSHKLKILLISSITHDVKRFVVEKPRGYKFTPGQATEVALDKGGWTAETRPFTFTSLNADKNLEFTIKGYPLDKNPKHKGMTQELFKVKPGDKLIIGDPWGTISYKNKGVFIAGGAGITPFIAVFRQLSKEGKLAGNRLIFSNKTKKDVILEKELKEMFGEDDLTLVLTRENTEGDENVRVDEEFLKKHVGNFDQHFYVCGPWNMVKELKKILEKLGAKTDSIVFEK